MEASLIALGGALLVAGILARLGRRVRLPTIPLFVLAGIALGPHTPGISLVDSPADLGLLATFGLVMLLFHLGLEFSLPEVLAGGRQLATAGAVFLGANVVAGLALGFGFGWGDREALVVAGAVAISSSAIVSKLIGELRRADSPETALILGIVVIEDVFLALYLAVIQPVLSDAGGSEILVSIASAFGFLIAFALVARFGSRFVRRLLDADSDELLIVSSSGSSCSPRGWPRRSASPRRSRRSSWGSSSPRRGSRLAPRRLVLPIRDVFGAIFFFVFGVSIRPDLMVDVWALHPGRRRC